MRTGRKEKIMGVFEIAKRHMQRTPYQSLAAVTSMFLTFLLTGVFSLLMIASVQILQYFESKPQITVFFTDKTSEKEAQDLQATLEATGKTESVKYVSKEDALALYREQNKNDPLLLEMVTADILPASLEVSAKDPKLLKDLEPIIKEADGVQEVVFQRDVIETLLAWTNAIRLVGGTLALLLAFNSVLVIMTIITMKVALKKDEIDILRLVGASPWYIRAPFIAEGGLYGVIGASIATVIIVGVLLWLRPFLLTFLGTIPPIHAYLADPTSAYFILATLVFSVGLILISFLLGSIGSSVALSRYLKI